jgi:rare lipoprotein A
VSRYANKFTGRRTANGERYNPYLHTAANRRLPFGTCVKLTDPRYGLSTFVRINDRGPWVRGRSFDVSAAASKDLFLIGIKRLQYKVVPSFECALP